jgi:low affinity Fe/Cu permease
MLRGDLGVTILATSIEHVMGRNSALGAWFGVLASHASKVVGSPEAFVVALTTIVIWALTGSSFHYSDTWQLIINTGTTVVTFLTVFLIQNTQNRDARAIHLKLDELIRAIRGAHDGMIDIEKLSDSELERLAKHYQTIKREYEVRKRRR